MRAASLGASATVQDQPSHRASVLRRARVAERQTRWLQVPVSERAWGFKSPSRTVGRFLLERLWSTETPGQSDLTGSFVVPGGLWRCGGWCERSRAEFNC